MKKIDGWDSAPAYTGDMMSLPAGLYKCKIMDVKISADKDGDEMLVLAFDIAEGEFKDFYAKQLKANQSSNANASWKGVYRQKTHGNSLPFFKGIITSIERSNNGFMWNWDETKLKGKLFGGVFGREEFLTFEGEKKMSTKCMQIRSVEGLLTAKIPEDKLIEVDTPAQAPTRAPGIAGDMGFVNIPDGVGNEGLPFN